jgi:hypothetical protein
MVIKDAALSMGGEFSAKVIYPAEGLFNYFPAYPFERVARLNLEANA